MTSISAVGSSALSSLSGANLSNTALQAQLSRFQAQLADWESCPSCKTPEGKAKIQELSDKVSETKQSIQSIQAAKAQSPNAPVALQASATASGSATAPGKSATVVGVTQVGAPGGAQGSRQGASTATGTIGSLLNVFA